MGEKNWCAVWNDVVALKDVRRALAYKRCWENIFMQSTSKRNISFQNEWIHERLNQKIKYKQKSTFHIAETSETKRKTFIPRKDRKISFQAFHSNANYYYNYERVDIIVDYLLLSWVIFRRLTSSKTNKVACVSESRMKISDCSQWIWPFLKMKPNFTRPPVAVNSDTVLYTPSTNQSIRLLHT